MPSQRLILLVEHVTVDLDEDRLTTPFKDGENFPPELMSGLKDAAKRVRNLSEHAPGKAERAFLGEVWYRISGLPLI